MPGKYIRTEKMRENHSKVMLGKHWKLKEETKEKMSKNSAKYWLGKKLSDEHKKKVSIATTGKKNGNWGNPSGIKGARAGGWKGGITAKHLLIRTSKEYKLWRTAVFERDDFTCIWCGDDKGGNLEADHIKPFAQYPELRFAIDNGRTLCHNCHKTTETYGNKNKKHE